MHALTPDITRDVAALVLRVLFVRGWCFLLRLSPAVVHQFVVLGTPLSCWAAQGSIAVLMAGPVRVKREQRMLAQSSGSGAAWCHTAGELIALMAIEVMQQS